MDAVFIRRSGHDAAAQPLDARAGVNCTRRLGRSINGTLRYPSVVRRRSRGDASFLDRLLAPGIFRSWENRPTSATHPARCAALCRGGAAYWRWFVRAFGAGE